MLDDLAKKKRKKEKNTENRKKKQMTRKKVSDARKKRTFPLDLSLQNLQRNSLFGSVGYSRENQVRRDFLLGS